MSSLNNYPFTAKMGIFVYDKFQELLEGTDYMPVLINHYGTHQIGVWDKVREELAAQFSVYLVYSRYHNEFAQGAGLAGRLMADRMMRAELRQEGVILPPEPDQVPEAENVTKGEN